MPPRCPYCNEELEYEERWHSNNEGDYYYETWAGNCPQCKRKFSWDEIYTFSNCDNLEEIKELE